MPLRGGRHRVRPLGGQDLAFDALQVRFALVLEVLFDCHRVAFGQLALGLLAILKGRQACPHRHLLRRHHDVAVGHALAGNDLVDGVGGGGGVGDLAVVGTHPAERLHGEPALGVTPAAALGVRLAAYADAGAGDDGAKHRGAVIRTGQHLGVAFFGLRRPRRRACYWAKGRARGAGCAACRAGPLLSSARGTCHRSRTCAAFWQRGRRADRADRGQVWPKVQRVPRVQQVPQGSQVLRGQQSVVESEPAPRPWVGSQRPASQHLAGQTEGE
jgi:hypothetical protein